MMKYVGNLHMIIYKDVVSRIVKINKVSKKDWCNFMNNYTSNKYEHAKNMEDEEIAKEIIKYCGFEKILSKSTFEINTKNKNSNNLVIDETNLEDIDVLDKKIDFQNEIVGDNEIADFKRNVADLKSKIRTQRYKIFYLNCMKKQAINNCNIKKAVSCGNELCEIEAKENLLISDLNQVFDNMKNLLIKNKQEYLSLLDFVMKNNCTLVELKQKYNLDIVNYFVVAKFLYLLNYYLGGITYKKIIQVFEQNEYLKLYYDSFFCNIKRGLMCGNK